MEQRNVLMATFQAAHPESIGALKKRLDWIEALQALANEPEDLPRTFGPFELMRLLGRGGMGRVYLALDTLAGRHVALKLPRQGLHFLAQGKERFEREIQVASRLEHPNLCPVLGAGQVEGRPYLALGYLRGQSLAEQVHKARRKGVLLAPTAMVALVEKIAQVLHMVHEEGFVHCDVKPANIMVLTTGKPILMDFGLAVDRFPREPKAPQERTGTPAYMAPEQIEPRGKRIDPRVDLYSLGVTLYECLTLRCPFWAPDRETLFRKIVQDPPPDPRRFQRDLPQALVAILAKALEKQPRRRYRTAQELALDLGRFLETRGARPAGLRVAPRSLAGAARPCAAGPCR